MTKLGKLFIVAVLFTTNLYAMDFSVSQGVSFIKTDSIAISMDNGTFNVNKNNKVASFTNLGVNNSFVNADATAELSKDYTRIAAEVTGKYELGNITPFVKANFGYTQFSLDEAVNRTTERTYLDLYAGISASGSFSFVTVNFSGYAGYVFLNNIHNYNNIGLDMTANNNNTMITGLQVSVELSDYFEAYFAMESYQVFAPGNGSYIESFSPNAINNKFGFKAHYEFDNGIGVYLIHTYNCCHPEKPYEMSRSNYDTNRSDFTIGVKYTF